MSNDGFDRLPLVLNAEEAAAALRISKWAVYEAIKRGEIRSVRVGRVVRIPRAAIAELPGVDLGPVGDG